MKTSLDLFIVQEGQTEFQVHQLLELFWVCPSWLRPKLIHWQYPVCDFTQFKTIWDRIAYTYVFLYEVGHDGQGTSHADLANTIDGDLFSGVDNIGLNYFCQRFCCARENPTYVTTIIWLTFLLGLIAKIDVVAVPFPPMLKKTKESKNKISFLMHFIGFI